MKKVKKNRGIDAIKDKYGRLFTTPWLIGLILFFIIPMFQSIYFSFSEIMVIPGGIESVFVGLKNYKQLLFADPDYTQLLSSAMASFLYSLPVILLLSLVLAIFLNQKFRGRLFFRALYFLPVIIASGSVITWLFKTTSNDLNNLGVSESYTAAMFSVDDIIGWLQIDGQIAEYITQTISKIFDLIWSCGIQTVLFLAGLQSIPRTLYEASHVEGATKWEEFWFITFPMLSRVILLVMVFTMVELMTNIRTAVVRKAYTMMDNGVFDTTSAMLWFYFLIVGCVMAVLIFVYKQTLMRRWDV
ncbi:MAG: sugar ABC transporter permease [Clostridia bacterium]|nr:sugar ABC transporter permease [Clostridia bacterium]